MSSYHRDMEEGQQQLCSRVEKQQQQQNHQQQNKSNPIQSDVSQIVVAAALGQKIQSTPVATNSSNTWREIMQHYSSRRK
jgi:hypothetical protein